MFELPTISALKCLRKATDMLLPAVSLIVFTFLDFLEIFFCMFYRFIDALLEENKSPCYCENRGEEGNILVDGGGDRESQVSETLYQRKNIFRDLGIRKWVGKKRVESMKQSGLKSRWSDCNCDTCSSWKQSGDQKLHVVLLEPSQQAIKKDCCGKPGENVIFMHGFLSSSLFWTETVFPNLSENGKQNYRLFAVDLFGFGKSPKPSDSLYTLKDHVEMIEKSVIAPFHLNSFHIVAHSMGCIVALAVAAKYPSSVKSITLVAPPYLPSSKENASIAALNRLAARRLWPPLLFGSAVMSWYEHLGRSVCFIICRNHRRWEWILKLLTRRRDLNVMFIDLTRHTHHSAWHTMHNVICGGAKLMDDYLEIVKETGMVLTVIQGDKDQVVPLECGYNMKIKVPHAEVRTISNANHSSVINGREQQFTRDLENIWFSAAEKCHHLIF